MQNLRRIENADMDQIKKNTAYYHLPGLFEFYELYHVFLPLFREHREYFYDWCEIGSVYGAPSDCIWGGGRTSFGDHDPQEVFAPADCIWGGGRTSFGDQNKRIIRDFILFLPPPRS